MFLLVWVRESQEPIFIQKWKVGYEPIECNKL